MAWTETARRDYVRRGLRYASDCTDDEWAVVAPLLQPMGKAAVRASMIHAHCGTQSNTSRQPAANGRNYRRNSRRLRRCSTISTGCATTACLILSMKCWLR